MLPTFIQNNTRYGALRHAVFNAECGLRDAARSITSTYLTHLILSKPAVVVSLTTGWFAWAGEYLAGALHLIVHIILGCSEVEMGGINTSRNIAFMEHPLVSGDWASEEFPGYAVGNEVFSWRAEGVELAITEASSFASPEPAGFSLGNLPPKPIYKRFPTPKISASSATVIPLAVCNVRGAGMKNATAYRTRDRIFRFSHDYLPGQLYHGVSDLGIVIHKLTV